MLAENHVMQVLYKKNFHSMIKSCYARSFIRKMYIKSCYGKFFGTNINIMLCKIMLWVYHVRRGLAVVTKYTVLLVKCTISKLYSLNVVITVTTNISYSPFIPIVNPRQNNSI